MFRNTLTANDKYPFRDCVNLSSAIEMQLSLKPKIFTHFFVPFLEPLSNFKHFEEKMILIATFFRKLHTVKELVKQLFKKDHLRNSFDNQHIKGSQTLVKSESEQFYQILS